MNKAAKYMCYKLVCGYMFSLLLGNYLVVELLSFMVSMYVTVEEMVTFSGFLLYQQCIEKFQLLRLLVSTWFCHCFPFEALCGCAVSLIVVLIQISLVMLGIFSFVYLTFVSSFGKHLCTSLP